MLRFVVLMCMCVFHTRTVGCYKMLYVFVNPSFIMSGEHRYLTAQSLVELANFPGASIGAHGYSHRKLTECTPSELEYELDASKKWIEAPQFPIIGKTEWAWLDVPVSPV